MITLIILIAIQNAVAIILKGRIDTQARISQKHKILPQTIQQKQRQQRQLKVLLNLGLKTYYPDIDKNFNIQLKQDGQYFISIDSPVYIYEAANIQISNGQAKVYRVHPYNRLPIQKDHSRIIVLRRIQKIIYFEVRVNNKSQNGLSIMGLLSNSYVVMMVFGIGMMFCFKQIMPALSQAQKAAQQPNKQD